MSLNNSMGGSNTEGAKYQPKFKDCKLEEKGGDKTLRRWITLIGSVEWKYNGDPAQWKMDFINFTREM